MSSKQVDADIKQLVALGYSKSKAQKAMKECRNNLKLAKQYLEASKEEEDKKAHEQELAAKAKALAEKQKKEAEDKRKARESKTVEEQIEEDLSTMKRHPCVQQYGSCRYGQHCRFRELPGDTCLQHVLGMCVYQDSCVHRHGINGVDIRRLMGLHSDNFAHEFYPLEDGTVVSIDRRNGKVQEGEIWVPEYQPEIIPAPLPEPSAFSAENGAAPSYSEPLHAAMGGRIHHAYASTDASPAANDFWGSNNDLSSHGTTTAGSGAGSSGLMGFVIRPNAHAPAGSPLGSMPGSPGHPTPAAHPTPFLNKALMAQNLPPPKPNLRPMAPPAAVAPRERPASQRSHPCVVQMGDCRFGDLCNHADVRGDVCVHWLNGRCRFTPDQCQYYHEHISAGAQPLNPRSGMGVPAQAAATSNASFGNSRTSMSGVAETSPGTLQPQQTSPALLFATNDIWCVGNHTPVAFGAAPLGPPKNQSEVDDEAWRRAFDPPTADESARRAGEAIAAKMAHDIALKESAAPMRAPSKWAGPPPSLMATDGSSSPGSKAIAADSAEEARAFDALMEAFPQADPALVLQALRSCGNDRNRVAHVIADATPMNVEGKLREAADEAFAESRSLALVTLCSLLPAMEPSSLERILADSNGDFGEAFTIAQSTLENIVFSDPSNRWSGNVRDEQGRDTGFNPAEMMKLERLNGMYKELQPGIVEKAFEVAKRNTQDAINILNFVVRDDKQLSKDERDKAGKAATTKSMVKPGKDVAKKEQAAAADSFIVTSCVEDTIETSPTLSETTLYQATKQEVNEHCDWRRVREEAYMANVARIQTLSLALNAYARQQHDVGKNLLRKSREYKAKYERLNMLAMHALEKERSLHHGVSALDLHGFHVDEALDVLARRIQLCMRKRVSKLRVIVGHGNHSKSGRSVIQPRVMEFVKAHPQCSVKSVLAAEIVVTIDLGH